MRIRLRRIVAGFCTGAKEVGIGVYRHDAIGLAAQISYSALFSLFPFLLFLRALIAYMPQAELLGDALLNGLGALISEDSRLYQIVADTVVNEVSATSGALLSVGVVLTLFSASGAIMTLIKAVNRAYGLEETRSWQRRRLMAAGLAIAGALFIPAAVSLVLFGSWLGRLIAAERRPGSLGPGLWIGLRGPVVVLLLVLAFSAFFYFTPNKRQRWYTVLPGAFFSVMAVMGVSLGLSWFVSQNLFEVRWLTYGAIGTVIVLLFWGFLGGLMILVGGEINAAVQRAVERSRSRLPAKDDEAGSGV